MPTRYQPEVLRRLHDGVRELWESTAALERDLAVDLERVAPQSRASARNLVHYLAVRRHDIRRLQVQLGHLGLSSLGRIEAHVTAGLESVLLALSRIADEPLPAVVTRSRPTFFREGDELLARHTDALFGPARVDRAVRIVVTLPTEAASSYGLVRELVAAGMDVARVNAAHDDPAAWERMVGNVRAAAAELGRPVRTLLDLAGPKLRTGALEPGPRVLAIQPRRDARGVVAQPAWVRLAGEGAARSPDGGPPDLPVEPALVKKLRVGDVVALQDAAGRPRELLVTGRDGESALARAMKSVYFVPGTALAVRRGGRRLRGGGVGDLPPTPSHLALMEGDVLLLTADPSPGRDVVRDASGAVVEPARIPCTLREVFGSVRPGERVHFDDGKSSGVVEGVTPAALRVRITRTPPGGHRLRSDKGINLPDSTIDLPSLGSEDLQALDFAVRHADLVGLSFVRTAADVTALHAALEARAAYTLGTMLKIETRRGFENLPQILLAGHRRPPFGVMVARGDLGVEVGFERMAEVQEEILWLCEAAHVPVVWATQVLERLTKSGMPTRGEVTDAAMSSRAEAVMLNKGPYVTRAVAFLHDVLLRMRDHHIKKTPMLRKLKVSEGRWEDGAAGAQGHGACPPTVAGLPPAEP